MYPPSPLDARLILGKMVDRTDETYNIKGHFYEQISKKGSFEVLNFSNVIGYILIYSTLITTLQCQE